MPTPSVSERGRVPLHWRATLATLHRLPQGALSRFFGLIADVPIPSWARPTVHGIFARMTGIDTSEIEKPFEAYPTLNDFFVRRLRRGARDWPTDPDLLCSPVDGVVGAFGRIERGRAIQAKGLDYSVAELLGGDEEQAAIYEGGLFLTIYLSPRHYHRIHTPIEGHILMARHVPGRLFPVNQPAVSSIENLFAVNERLICTLAGRMGPLAVVAVGAYNVGRISAAFDPGWNGRAGGWITNRPASPEPVRRYRDPIPARHGTEIMAFHLGSTIVLLTCPGVTLEPKLEAGLEVQVGDVIGRAARDTRRAGHDEGTRADPEGAENSVHTP